MHQRLFSENLIFLALLFGCGKSGNPITEAPAVIPNPVLQNNADCPNGTLLSYENFGEGFMLNYCTSCHARDLNEDVRNGAPTTVNLDRPEDMALWRAKMLKVAANQASATMPPSKHIRSQDRKKLAEWLACGAPAESDRVTGASD